MAFLHYSHNLGPSKLKSVGFNGCGWQLHAKHFELKANSQHYTQYLDRNIEDLVLSTHSILADDDFHSRYICHGTALLTFVYP